MAPETLSAIYVCNILSAQGGRRWRNYSRIVDGLVSDVGFGIFY
jgi:hypothetical protein